jgi:hypothetical protein
MSKAAIHCLVVTLVLSFTRDPFTHLHAGHDHQVDESGHEHVALAFHTHVDLDSSPARHNDEPEISAAKASANAQPLSFFHFRPEAPPPMPVLGGEMAWGSPVVFAISAISEPPPRAHDPPFVHSSIPRSPPV